MPGIEYNRVFAHSDWIDNEDVVQAEGENGFNVRFHGIEQELDKVSGVVGTIDVEIKKIQRLQFLAADAGITVPAATASQEFDVEVYSRDDLPQNVDKVYQVVLFPVAGPTHVQHTFLYRTVPGNQVKVTIQFFNPGAQPAKFNYRVLALASQGA